MEDMIQKIVEMDKKARDMTAEAQKSKINYEHEIIKTKENIKNDFLERAQKRIEINSRTARQKADEEIKEVKDRYAKLSQNLDKNYSENGDRWVDEIVSRVIGEQS